MLPVLLNLPKADQDWSVFSFHHRSSHDLIRQAIQAQRGVSLASYSLDPIPNAAFQQWLEWNQQSHIEMNNVLKAQSADLETLDPRDEHQLRAWVYLHYLEHQTAERILGISS